MNAQAEYEKWVAVTNHPQDIAEELQSIARQQEHIQESFSRDLEFGTGGLRGVLGAGNNRMNIYTVRRATRGLAQYLLKQFPDASNRGVVIGYDCRRMSPEFAEQAGLVLAAAGITAHVFPHLCPTPELSFAVRQLGAVAGIMITASHNPPEYNGYKVYGPDGGQILPEAATEITSEIQAITNMFDIPVADASEAESAGKLSWVGTDVDHKYVSTVVQSIAVPLVSAKARADLRIVYTPLHGTGYIPIRDALAETGYTNVHIVREQAEPDGAFPTVKSPNPEESAALAMATRQAKAFDADLAMGTDPDADRVGVAARDANGEYVLLTGNQTGGLLLDFWLRAHQSAGTLPKDGIVFKTIVTSELGAAVAREAGLDVEDTLTGFKYIGERIGHYEQTGSRTFVFGYEESYGYLAAPFVRDKDAVQSCLLIAEMAAWYKQDGLTLPEALRSLYERVGVHQEVLISKTLPGLDGMAKMAETMGRLRQGGLDVPGLNLVAVEDYEAGVRRFISAETADRHPSETVAPLTLPKADVLKYLFSGGSWLAIRPSGTEPKIKVYLGARAGTVSDCDSILQSMRRAVDEILAN